MKKKVESARRSAEVARDEIAKVLERYDVGQAEFDMVDDAFLGIGWAIKRLGDLEKRLSGTQGTPPPERQ